MQTFKMSKFVLNKQHLREILIFCFNWKKSAAEAQRLLVEVYGESAPTEESCEEWFQRFKTGDFGAEDKPRLGKRKKNEDEQPKAILSEDSSRLHEKPPESVEAIEQSSAVRLKSADVLEKPESEKTEVTKLICTSNIDYEAG